MVQEDGISHSHPLLNVGLSLALSLPRSRSIARTIHVNWICPFFNARLHTTAVDSAVAPQRIDETAAVAATSDSVP